MIDNSSSSKKQQPAGGLIQLEVAADTFLVDIGKNTKLRVQANEQPKATANRGTHTHYDEQEPEVAVLLPSSSDLGGGGTWHVARLKHEVHFNRAT